MSITKALTKVYTGSQITVSLVKELLEDNGVPSMVQDRYQSGIAAGFYAGSPGDIELYVNDNNVEKAALLITDFNNKLK